MKYSYLLFLWLAVVGFAFCTSDSESETEDNTKPSLETSEVVSITTIDTAGNTIASRFMTPKGFKRIEAKDHSFSSFLRSLKLKAHGAKVNYFDGSLKNTPNVYCAVVDLPIGKRDLHQCADAIMRLRADYLRSEERFEEIHFQFNTGFEANYDKWMKGYRIHYTGSKFYWTKDTEPSNSDKTYWKYLEYVFSFAGTYSLAQELPKVNESEMQIGDVFLWGGHPGHGVIVIDMAINKETGEKCFMLAQSYMPAQEIQILVNPSDANLSPWYSLDFGDFLNTPEWQFEKGYLKRF